MRFQFSILPNYLLHGIERCVNIIADFKGNGGSRGKHTQERVTIHERREKEEKQP